MEKVGLTLFIVCVSIFVALVVILILGIATEETMYTERYCTDSRGILFIHEQALSGIFENDEFRFMTPIEFETYCVKKVEGTH